MQHDISNELFYEICKFRRVEGKYGAEHVGKLCLNDMLACSLAVKKQIQEMMRLPPGYIVRPPTVAELERFFEFTAWGGNDFNLKHVDVINRPLPAIATISDEAPYTIKQYILPDILPDWNGYQSLPADSQSNDAYTLRLAIAPGDDSFYEKAYGSGVEIHSAQKDGKIYAALTTSVAFGNSDNVKKLAAIVNARLVEPPNFYEWKKIHALVIADEKSPALIGLEYHDGAWRRLSDGTVPKFGDPLPHNAEGDSICLAANRRTCVGFKPTRPMPTVILQWDSKEQWEHRGDAIRGNAQTAASANSIERVITVGGRRFALARFIPFPSYAVAPFCRYMGVTPAVFKDKKEMEEACRLLADINGTIALGALRHYDDWQWFDGTIVSISPQPERRTDHSIAPSPMLDCLAIENGKLVSAASVSFILIELD